MSDVMFICCRGELSVIIFLRCVCVCVCGRD